MSGSGRITPRLPHCPSGISVGNTHTRGATSSYFPPSARTTASVTSFTSALRDASVYCPSGTVGMMRYRGDAEGMPPTNTAAGRCRNTTDTLCATLLPGSNPSCVKRICTTSYLHEPPDFVGEWCVISTDYNGLCRFKQVCINDDAHCRRIAEKTGVPIMPQMTFTKLGIDKIQPPSKGKGQVQYFERRRKGLQLVLSVSYGGTKTWRAQF